MYAQNNNSMIGMPVNQPPGLYTNNIRSAKVTEQTGYTNRYLCNLYKITGFLKRDDSIDPKFIGVNFQVKKPGFLEKPGF